MLYAAIGYLFGILTAVIVSCCVISSEESRREEDEPTNK
jgi:hypothetical protein